MKQQCLGVYVADQGRHWPGTHGALAASCLRCPAGRAGQADALLTEGHKGGSEATLPRQV